MALNIVAEVGRMVADPELRQTNSGKTVCSFRIAVNNGKDNPAFFFDVVAWEHTAEFISRYFHKGDMIALSGRLSQRQWQDKNGNNRSTVEIEAKAADFTGSKSESAGQPRAEYRQQAQPAQPSYTPATDDFQLIDEGSEDLPF